MKNFIINNYQNLITLAEFKLVHYKPLYIC